MTPDRIAATLLSLAVAIAWVRLWLWRRRATVQGPAWRLAVLGLMQIAVAGLLYLTLFGSTAANTTKTLVVATEGAPRFVSTRAGETLVALPEAGNVAGAIRQPDLGTALRRHPGATAIRVVGSGLVARDRVAAATVTLRYAAPPQRRGLVALVPPPPVAPGQRFAVAARVEGGAAATLLDPAGRVVDTARPAADGSVVLHGTARVAGEALFALRLSDGTSAAVPLITGAVAPARALILAGAPGPEVKFLRRWAADAGVAAQTQVAVGGGLTLGEPPASYAGYDIAILDDRMWAGLGYDARATLAQAVRGGMGLVVRVTGPVAKGWQVLGLATGGGSAVVPLRLPPAAPGEAALAARRGPGTRDAPASIAAPLGEVPELTRLATSIGGVPLLRDVRGTPFAGWRNVGRGRVALVTLLDSFALATSGNGDAHADIWNAIASTVGRGTPAADIRIDPLAWAGERVAICATGGPVGVVAPDGTRTVPVPDPAAAGCAAYWPVHAGWHRAGVTPFYVHPAGALPALRAASRREATLALAGERRRNELASPEQDRRPSWRWFIAFLITAGALWWFERRRA